jgi:hypothetical protein
MDGYLALTRLPHPRTWFPPTTQPDVFTGLAAGCVNANTYIAMLEFGIRPPQGRGRGGDGRHLIALPFDVDVDDGSGAHAGAARLARSNDAAVDAVFNGLGYRPSMLWDSGHGIQGVLLLDPPVDLTTNLAVGYTIMARWAVALAAAADRTGVAFDPVADLARLLRVPGTVNNKVAGDPRPVRLLDVAPTAAVAPVALLEQLPAPRPTLRRTPSLSSASTDGDEQDDDPVTAWCRIVDWAELLEPAGWELAGVDGDVRYWRRPGKNVGVSASTSWRRPDRDGHADLLHVWSTNAQPLTCGWWSKPGAFAALHDVPIAEVLLAISRWSAR